MKPTIADRNDLFRAARRDGPDASQKSRIWQGVALAPQLSLVATAGRTSLHPGTVAAGATKTLAATAAAFSAGKLLLAGALVGSALTVGLGAFLLRGPGRSGVTPVTAPMQRFADALPSAYAPEVPAAAPLPLDVVFPVALEDAAPAKSVAGSAPPGARAATLHSAAAKLGVTNGDAFSREVALVGEARNALAFGGGSAALAALDAAARGRSRSLEPEELALRVRALRMLGRDAEADRVDGTLKSLYPGSFLAR
jgi:hypothetical protein